MPAGRLARLEVDFPHIYGCDISVIKNRVQELFPLNCKLAHATSMRRDISGMRRGRTKRFSLSQFYFPCFLRFFLARFASAFSDLLIRSPCFLAGIVSLDRCG